MIIIDGSVYLCKMGDYMTEMTPCLKINSFAGKKYEALKQFYVRKKETDSLYIRFVTQHKLLGQ